MCVTLPFLGIDRRSMAPCPIDPTHYMIRICWPWVVAAEPVEVAVGALAEVLYTQPYSKMPMGLAGLYLR